MSMVGETGEVLGGDMELDIEQLLQDFPDETLIYMSEKHCIGFDDEKREREYNAFKVCHSNTIVLL